MLVMAGPDTLLCLKTLLLAGNLGYKGLATLLLLPSSLRWVRNVHIGRTFKKDKANIDIEGYVIIVKGTCVFASFCKKNIPIPISKTV